jgi:hypothetical protein
MYVAKTRVRTLVLTVLNILAESSEDIIVIDFTACKVYEE